MRTLASTVFIALLVLTTNIYAEGVNRAVFTTAIQDREPVDQIAVIDSNTLQNVTFFTELTDLKDHSITHQWIYDNQLMYEKTFEIGSNRWRVWSSKSFLPTWTGEWTVKVLNEDFVVLESVTIMMQ